MYGLKSTKADAFDTRVVIDVSKVEQSLGSEHYHAWRQLYREMATKWTLNAVSTGAHILKGKIYQNIMVDVKVRYMNSQDYPKYLRRRHFSQNSDSVFNNCTVLRKCKFIKSKIR